MTEPSDYVMDLVSELRNGSLLDASRGLIKELDAAWDDGFREGYGEGSASHE